MPYAIDRLDNTPVIRILRSARNPIASGARSLPPRIRTHWRSLIGVRSFAFNDAAGEPVVGHAEFGPRVGLHAVVHDDRAPDDVGGSAVAHGDSADAGHDVRIAFGSGDEIGEVAQPLARQLARHGPYPARAGGVGRAAVADLMNEDAVATGRELLADSGNVHLVAALAKRNRPGHRAVLRQQPGGRSRSGLGKKVEVQARRRRAAAARECARHRDHDRAQHAARARLSPKGHQPLRITPQATRAPELPVGCVVKSSGSLCTITALPMMSVAALPMVITSRSDDKLALPEASASSMGMSPA